MNTQQSPLERFVEHVESYNLDIQCAMDGRLDAEIVIVSEYPGEQEVAFNKPFIGGAGKHLWSVLGTQKIHRGMCYVTNVVKRRVGAKTHPDATELQLWQESLLYELEALTGPKVIIALGNLAMETLVGHKGIQQFRGSVYKYKDTPVVCAYNPAFVLRMPQNEIVFQMDMARVREVLDGDYHEHKVHSAYNIPFKTAMEYLDYIHHDAKRFAMDIETIGQQTACLGLATSGEQGNTINFRDQTDNFYTVEEEYKILRKYLEVCDDPTTTCIAQNGNFDSYFMGYKDHARFRVDFDTLLAHHTLYPRLPHNLGFLTAQYTHHPFYKDEKDKFYEQGNINDFWTYNGKDAALTYAIATELERELKEQNLYDFFTNHVMAVHPNLAEATVDGIRVDDEAKAYLHSELKQTVQTAKDKFITNARKATGDQTLDINPNSPAQLKRLFFDKLKLTSTRKSTDAKVRESWLKDPRCDEETKNTIIALNQYAEENKFFTTYVKAQLDPDNRFRSEYKQYGVSKAPGRLSSSQTLWGSGGNAQNLPHRAYEMFIVDDEADTVFIYFDLAQAEARYVGWDAEIDQWMEDFEKARTTPGFDAHRSLASIMFNTEYDLVPKKDIDEDGNFTIRYVAKRCRHGLNYRMHIERLAETTGMTRGQAARNYYKYHQTNPELQPWWQKLEREVKKTRMLFNSYGRRLFITERLEGEALDSIVAFRPQSTIGDKVQRVWAQCHNDDRWDKSKAKIRMNVHDALWGIAHKDFAMTALSIMKKYAEEPIMVKSIMSGKVRPMIVPADMKISDTTNGKKLSMANMMDVDVEKAA